MVGIADASSATDSVADTLLRRFALELPSSMEMYFSARVSYLVVMTLALEVIPSKL